MLSHLWPLWCSICVRVCCVCGGTTDNKIGESGVKILATALLTLPSFLNHLQTLNLEGEYNVHPRVALPRCACRTCSPTAVKTAQNAVLAPSGNPLKGAGAAALAPAVAKLGQLRTLNLQGGCCVGVCGYSASGGGA